MAGPMRSVARASDGLHGLNTGEGGWEGEDSRVSQALIGASAIMTTVSANCISHGTKRKEAGVDEHVGGGEGEGELECVRDGGKEVERVDSRRTQFVSISLGMVREKVSRGGTKGSSSRIRLRSTNSLLSFAQ